MAKEGTLGQDWEIMDKLDNGSYTLYRIPCALYLQNGKVYFVGKNVYEQDPIESLERHSNVPHTGSPNLEIEFYILSSLKIGMINKKLFPSRGDLDRLSFQAWCPPYWKKCNEEKVKKFGNLLFEEALENFRCTIYCNMKHYLAQEDKTKKKLDHRLKKLQLSDQNLKQSQKQLLYKLLLDIFGNVNEEDEKEEQKKETIILKDFRLVLDDEELKIGTAERGNHYIVVYWTGQN